MRKALVNYWTDDPRLERRQEALGRVAPAGGSGNVHVPVAVGGAALLVGLGLAGRDAASGLLDRSGKQAPAQTRSAGKARPGPTTPATRRVRRTRAPREQQRERRERFRR